MNYEDYQKAYFAGPVPAVPHYDFRGSFPEVQPWAAPEKTRLIEFGHFAATNRRRLTF